MFDNDNLNTVKEAKVTMDQDAILEYEGDYFGCAWLIKNYNGQNNGSQNYKVKFNYMIYNTFNPYDSSCRNYSFQEIKTYTSTN